MPPKIPAKPPAAVMRGLSSPVKGATVPPAAPSANPGRKPESDKVKAQRALVDKLAKQYDTSLSATKCDVAALEELANTLATERRKLDGMLS